MFQSSHLILTSIYARNWIFLIGTQFHTNKNDAEILVDFS